MLTARTPHTTLVQHLISLSPFPSSPILSTGGKVTNPIQTADTSGNTPLHYASAYGQLKSIRTLLENGADASARNAWSWTPVSYSASVQAEVYFKGLVHPPIEGGRSRGGSGPKAPGVRLVSAEDSESLGFERMRRSGESANRMRAGSGE